MLYDYFRSKTQQQSPDAIATILNAFAFYEAAKSDAGIMLSTKDFKKLNPILSEEWNKMRERLSMNSSI